MVAGATTNLGGWTLIDSYFKDRRIAQMEIDSFNQFVDKKLAEIIDNDHALPAGEERLSFLRVGEVGALGGRGFLNARRLRREGRGAEESRGHAG